MRWESLHLPLPLGRWSRKSFSFIHLCILGPRLLQCLDGTSWSSASFQRGRSNLPLETMLEWRIRLGRCESRDRRLRRYQLSSPSPHPTLNKLCGKKNDTLSLFGVKFCMSECANLNQDFSPSKGSAIPAILVKRLQPSYSRHICGG